MPTLAAAIQALAQSFASGVLDAIRSSSLEEILAQTTGAEKRRPGGPGRPRKEAAPAPAAPDDAASGGRRSANAIESTAAKIVAFVKAHPGANSETIRGELKIPKNHWSRPLERAIETKRVTKKGEKRATRYFAA